MKRNILLIIILTTVCRHNIDAQCNPVYGIGADVYACNNIAINTVIASCEFSSSQKADIKASLLAEFGSIGITNNNILDDASSLYNCHSYAWYLKEGHTDKVWINSGTNNSNISKYWNSTNSCFIECSEAEAEKIHYYVGDHSAVKSTVQGMYESKWGQLPVIRHSPTQVPPEYKASYRKYYKRRVITLTLSGPSNLCLNSSATYAINNFPTNATVTWNQSSNLQQVSGSGASKVFKGIANGAGWIEATVNGIASSRLNVWVGPSAPFINGIWRSASPRVYSFKLEDSVGEGNSTRVIWSIYTSSTATTPLFQFTSSFPLGTYSFPSQYNGIYYASAVVVNSCGQSDPSWKRTSFKVESGIVEPSITFIAPYPNPADNILNIEIDENAVVQTKSLDKQTAIGSKIIRQNAAYDIRLYDGLGNLLRQATATGGKIEFNVANLPNGIYYLHIYDGVNEKPEMRQIVVQH